MKLTYWVIECLDDSRHYNIKAKTKKEALAKLQDYRRESYGEVKKVEIEYSDAFDLMQKSSGEDFCWWE